VLFVCIDYFLNVETTLSPKRKASIITDALKEIKPMKINPLFDISSPRLTSNKERMKQIVVSKAIVMLVFFIVFVFFVCVVVI
jgi:hypothetical protein